MNELIKKALEEKHMSQKELAEKLYVTPQAVSKWVNGESQPTFDNIQRMIEIFDGEFANKIIKKGIKEKHIMDDQTTEIKNLCSIEKALDEAKRILNRSRADDYSHAVYVLLSWLVPAAIGLTYHQFINNKDKDAEFFYEDIFYHLNNYFEECVQHPRQYRNELSYEFFLMGGDLFESFEPNKLVNHDYAHDAMDLWYRFEKAINNSGSTIIDEFKIALTDIISNNSCY